MRLVASALHVAEALRPYKTCVLSSAVSSAEAPLTTTMTQQDWRPSDSQEGIGLYADPALQVSILNSTNTYRALFQAQPLAWDQSLASEAAQDARTCDFVHTNAGQNLAAGYSSPRHAVEDWADEYKNFDFTHPDYQDSTGHFTQLVWQQTQRVGCSAAACPSDGTTTAQGWFLVCNYLPVGNIIGQFESNIHRISIVNPIPA